MDEYSADDLPMSAPSVGGSAPVDGSTADKGYKCEQKFPLSGGFWTQPPKNGEA